MKPAILSVAALALIAPCSAHAEPGLASEVYGPGVERGHSEIEGRYGALNGGGGGGAWQFKGEAAYGVTSWWRPAAVIEIERMASGESSLSAVALENIFDFTGTQNWPVHLGAYAEYEINTQDGPDKVELKLLGERNIGQARLRLNLIGEREVGSGASDDWEFGYAAQGLWAVSDDFGFGIEGFGDASVNSDLGGFGKLPQYWGPFVQFEPLETPSGDIEVQAGYLVGGGDPEGQGQFRLRIEWEH